MPSGFEHFRQRQRIAQAEVEAPRRPDARLAPALPTSTARMQRIGDDALRRIMLRGPTSRNRRANERALHACEEGVVVERGDLVRLAFRDRDAPSQWRSPAAVKRGQAMVARSVRRAVPSGARSPRRRATNRRWLHRGAARADAESAVRTALSTPSAATSRRVERCVPRHARRRCGSGATHHRFRRGRGNAGAMALQVRQGLQARFQRIAEVARDDHAGRTPLGHIFGAQQHAAEIAAAAGVDAADLAAGRAQGRQHAERIGAH